MSSTPPMSMFFLADENLNPEFVHPEKDKHLCIQCNNMLRPPVKMIRCGHRMCNLCLSESKQSGVEAKCPGGEPECVDTDLLNDGHIFPDIGTERELKKLLVFCKNKSNGCKMELFWSSLEDHLKTCEYKPIACPHVGCNKVLNIKTIEQHKAECGYQMVDCIHCSEQVTRHEMLNGHENKCASKPKECPFKSMGCNFQGLKHELDEHLQSKGHLQHIQALVAKYQEMKTYEETMREDLENMKAENQALRLKLETINKEKNDMKQKLDKKIQNLQKVTANNMEDINELEEQIKEPVQKIAGLQSATENHEKRLITLESQQSTGTTATMSTEMMSSLKRTDQSINMHDIQLAELQLRFQCLETTCYEGTLIWKITDYTRRKKEAIAGHTISLYSQPFYTSKYGYKMCARIYLNGDGMGKNTHMSLFFVVMKGEYDALLPWPFRQKVTLSLVDQENGTRHVSDTFKPDPTSSSFKKPIAEMNVASGCPLFVAQEVAESTRYKQNETIFIKVHVDTQDLVV